MPPRMPLSSWAPVGARVLAALLAAASLGPPGAVVAQAPASPARAPRIEVTIAPEAHRGPLTGRLVIAIARQQAPEPRLLISPVGPQIVGIDLEGVRPGQPTVVDASAIGYPGSLAELPAGEYFAQAVINVYEQARRADGHTIWVPLNDGRQAFFSNAAGNLVSDVQRVRLGGSDTVRLTVTRILPDEPKPADTEWVKRVRIQSAKLTKFWGRPIYVHATVLLPRGYADRRDVRYPVIFALGHSVPFGFTTDSTRVRNPGQINPVTGVETGFDFYKAWNADGFPRVIAVSLEHQTPYFPDAYSVNSANNGPYGDAVIEEVIPELERQFRMLGKPYARHVEGASTGGWQTLALQLRYPDVFGGAWVLQPDPIDFRRYLHTNIYTDTNAFVVPVGPFTTTERPFRRTTEGQVVWTMRQLSRFEAVLGSRGRSGYQLGAWEAVYGPVGPDGYPKPLWNPLTGTIDREVAHYMRDNGYDLREYAQRNWATLGPKLQGKLRFFVPDMDDFYLNLAMYQFEAFLKSTSNPKSDATFTYGRPTKGHSWHAWTWAEFVRQVGDAVAKNAPAGEDTRAWRY
jgi:S-formylglutathione hydrolase FrmB